MSTQLLISIAIISLLSFVLTAYLFFRNRNDSQGTNAKLVADELKSGREESSRLSRELREEVANAQNAGFQSLMLTLSQLGNDQSEKLREFASQIRELTASTDKRLGNMNDTVERQLVVLREGNEKKLDQMRLVVDEKLQGTLEKRLGESFKLVSDRLEAVQLGLGEMRNLATGVGDLKRVLTNVKTRGTWGEVQLGSLLEQILTPDQFEQNVQTKSGSREAVEFAIKLPGPDQDRANNIWLPIDAKFPQEDYIRLLDATENGDVGAVQAAMAALVKSVQSSAKSVSTKYVNPPKTTDFAIMFLPTEGLYAEVLKQPGLIEKLQDEYRVVLAGPTTLAAILNSLRMGFRTLAIERQSSEVWQVLAGVKTEFGKFAVVLEKVKKQLDTARRSIDDTDVRTRAIERTLRSVEEMPVTNATELFAAPKKRLPSDFSD